MYPYIHTGDSIVIVINGKPNVIALSHPNFTKIGDAIKASNWSAIDTLVDIPEAVKRFSEGELEVFDNEVRFQGEPLHNAAVDRLLAMMNQGFDVKPLVNFLNRVVNNPDRRAVDGLYSWLERGNLPISPDGCIIAYKLVRDDFMDHYTGKFDHTPGNIVSQSRFKCDPDPNRTCSTGLHFCSAAYLPCYGGSNSKVVLVKIDPADVVAFPHDYNISKGRCCRYEVLQEIDRETAASFFGGTAVFNTVADEEEVDETEENTGECGFSISVDDDGDLKVSDYEGDKVFFLDEDGIFNLSWVDIDCPDQDGIRCFEPDGIFDADEFSLVNDELLWLGEPVLRFTSEHEAELVQLDPDRDYPFKITRDGYLRVND